MKKFFFKYFNISILGLLLSACSNAYINHENKLCITSINHHTVFKNPFIVCASFYTSKSTIFSTAELYCFKHNKKPRLLKVSYFTNCSLIRPISYVFICE